MKIEVLRALTDNFIFVLHDGTNAVVVDPGEAGPVRSFLNQNKLKLTHILCTHHHPDHVAGVLELAAKSGAKVLCSIYDFTRIEGATTALSGGQTLEFFDESVTILELPGHTLGQIAFWFQGSKAVFVGDTLFSCGCGRLFEGTPTQMFKSMVKLRTLPTDTQIFFGHEYTLNNIAFLKAQGFQPEELELHEQNCRQKIAQNMPTVPTTIELELKVNPLFSANDEHTFIHWRTLRNSW